MVSKHEEQTLAQEGPGLLAGLRVVEGADEMGEHCGMLLAGLGAEVIKVEPPGGSPTRRIGPFLDDHPNPERSIHFWGYNRGKRSVVPDLDSADIFLDAAEETRCRPRAGPR